MTEPAARRPQESPPWRVSSPRVLPGTPAVKTGRGTRPHTGACWCLADSPRSRGTWEGDGHVGPRPWARSGRGPTPFPRIGFGRCVGPRVRPGILAPLWASHWPRVDGGRCAERGWALCPLPGTLPWGTQCDAGPADPQRAWGGAGEPVPHLLLVLPGRGPRGWGGLGDGSAGCVDGREGAWGRPRCDVHRAPHLSCLGQAHAGGAVPCRGWVGGLSGGGGAHKRPALVKLDALREPEGGLEVAGQGPGERPLGS